MSSLQKAGTSAVGAVAFAVMLIAGLAAAVVSAAGSAAERAAERAATNPNSGPGQVIQHIIRSLLNIGYDMQVPPRVLTLYMQVQPTCPHLSWTLLASIGKAETDNNRDPNQISTAGAVGPMQFMPSTFAEYAYPVPPGGANPPTPWDLTDAVYAAARKLCADGVKDGHIEQAIYAYNHSTAYVAEVLNYSQTYANAAITTTPEAPTTPGAPSPAAQTAINYAMGQLGIPYEWGGDGPSLTDPTAGFDCSGLVQAAYAAAGISLPRVAGDQYAVTTPVPPGAPLESGDLVFYGTSSYLHHVAIYIGNGDMIDAPRTGAVVRIEPYRYAGDDFYGATRVATGQAVMA